MFFSTDPCRNRPRSVACSKLSQVSNFRVSISGFPVSELPLQLARLPHVEVSNAGFRCQNSFPSHTEIGPNRVFLHTSCEKKSLTSFVAARIVEVGFEHDHHLRVPIGFPITAYEGIEGLTSLTFTDHCALLQSRSRTLLDCSTPQRHIMASHPKQSAKKTEGDTRPFTRSDFLGLVRKASATPFQQPSPRSRKKSDSQNRGGYSEKRTR